MLVFIIESAWYIFATISTIGFGDVIAGVDYEDCTEDNTMDFTLLFWVSYALLSYPKVTNNKLQPYYKTVWVNFFN